MNWNRKAVQPQPVIADEPQTVAATVAAEAEAVEAEAVEAEAVAVVVAPGRRGGGCGCLEDCNQRDLIASNLTSINFELMLASVEPFVESAVCRTPDSRRLSRLPPFVMANYGTCFGYLSFTTEDW